MLNMEKYGIPNENTPMIGKRNRRCKFIENFPARYALALLGFVGFINVYAMRVNLSVAMVAMVNKTALDGPGGPNTLACPELLPQNLNETEEVVLKGDGIFFWDSNVQAIILGSFFYGYVVTQIPGGVLAQRFGAKWLFGLGVLTTSVCTLMTPPLAYLGTTYIIALRIIEGLAEGVTFPAVNALIGWWVPKMERSRISTLIFTGSPVGTIFAMALSGVLSGSSFFGGWPSVFYVIGSLGCVWFFFWSVLVYDKPHTHPRISKEELIYIEQNKEHRNPNVPWRCILTSVPVWALAITHFGQNWGYYTLLTEMPTYMSTILHFDIKKNGLLSSLPYIVQAICAWVAGFIADKLRENGKMTITTIRKIINSIAFFGPACCLLAVAFVGCQPALIVTLLCAAMGFNGFMYSGFNVTHVDMSPDHAGTLMGITNCISNLSGFLAPYVVGLFTSGGQTLHSWSMIFVIASAVYFFTGSIYNLFCTAEQLPWGAAPPSTQRIPPDNPLVATQWKKQLPPTIVTIPEKQ